MPAAILPANIDGDTLYSHQGLTYGGWSLPPSGIDEAEFIELWRCFLQYCKSVDIKSINYKCLPYIYSLMPSQEDRYAMFLSEAKIDRLEVSSAIDMDGNPGFNKLQRRHLSHIGEGVEIRLTDYNDDEAIVQFHAMLTSCLKERHDTTPVHSLSELHYLMGEFPNNIRIWGAYSEGELHAGICGYITRTCLHCQYIATDAKGREKNLLAAVVKSMEEYCNEEGIRYLDFGVSTEDGGRLLNIGLNRQKTSFGASAVAYEHYYINVDAALAKLPTSLWPRS